MAGTPKFKNSGKGATMAAFMALAMSGLKIYDTHDGNLAGEHAFGRRVEVGTFGGENYGDIRWMTPGLVKIDPGRRPPF